MKHKRKSLLILSIFLLSLNLIIIHLDYTSRINAFNPKDEYNLDKDLNELQEVQASTSGPADKYNFMYYKIITIDHTKVFGSSDYRNFPLLISIFDSDLHEDVQFDGDDIAFANDSEWLDHEIELFDQIGNGTHAQLIAWVRVPILNISKNTNITMFYGNPYLNSQENPTGVWDDNYKGVWHMNEVNAIDSTSNNNGTESGGVSNIVGKITDANYFEGVDEFITIGNVGSEIKTIEFWMKPSNLGSLGPTETAWKNPSATGDNYSQWNNPTNAFASDDAYSSEDTQGEMQDWYNFNFSVPNGATIDGIQVNIEATTIINVGAGIAISWNGGIDYTSEKSSIWSTPEENITFGGPSDLWGETWSSDDFKDSNFRIRLRRSSQNPGIFLNLDYIEIKVYFTYVFMKIIDLNGTAQIEIVEGDLITTNIPDTSTIYIDGAIKSSLTTDWYYIAITNSEGINVSNMDIGRVSTNYFDGIIDELRISDTLRNPESFNTSIQNQNDPVSFYNITQEINFNTDPPIYSNLTESSNILELGEIEIISINITDPSGIKQVKIEFEGSDHNMTYIGGDIWRYNSWTPSHTDNYSYTIYMEDNCGIWNSVNNSILVVDTTSPIYSNLIESIHPLELGDTIIISINASDLSGINEVLIEFEGSNHSMVNLSGNTWQYDLWTPSHTDNYSYTIYIEDNNNHWNSISDSVEVVDTTLPTYSNLIESADPLELGTNITISLDVSDFSGINRVLVEFEASNHSMVNIGGNTWQYNLWNPVSCKTYQYKIYYEDNNNLWNLIINNITVQDTTPPLPPIMIHAPSSGTNDTITFDWEDGFDHSGISYYILIIDNETDFYTTPGFIYYINITNTGLNSSYYELNESLLPGTYYYFLCQVDGVGLQSNFAVGSVTISPLNKGNKNLTFLDILPYLLGSIIASVAIIFIVRRRIQHKMHPPRKKILLKVIISHINKISTVKSTFEKKEHKEILDDQLTFKKETLDEEELENRLNDIKTLGEELFNEGAYLEAQRQFEIAEELVLKLDKKDEALFYSKLIAHIKSLSEEREVKLENLENEKEKNNFINVMDIYIDLIQISKKLKDFDMSNMFQFELIQLLKDGNLKISDLEHKRNKLEEQANIYLDQNHFEEAAKFYEYCEEISQILLHLDRLEENYNIDKFRDKINEVLKKIK